MLLGGFVRSPGIRSGDPGRGLLWGNSNQRWSRDQRRRFLWLTLQRTDRPRFLPKSLLCTIGTQPLDDGLTTVALPKSEPDKMELLAMLMLHVELRHHGAGGGLNGGFESRTIYSMVRRTSVDATPTEYPKGLCSTVCAWRWRLRCRPRRSVVA
jgi:hypothetical protein